MGKVETGDLDELIAKVEAGALVPVDLVKLSPADHCEAWCAYKGSLDAAKRLHDALLPGECWQVWQLNPGEYGCNLLGRGSAQADNPARAWLLAILRAVKALPGNGGVTATAARPGSGDA